jgi:hypothetical protein
MTATLASAILFLLIMSQCAKAETMPESHVRYLLGVAVILSGYEMPTHRPPTVIEINSSQMHEQACDDSDPGCMDVIGYYDGGEELWVDVEYTRANADTTDADAVVVHELTHWLQAREGRGVIGFGHACERSNAREVEAYHVEERFIREYQHKHVRLTPNLETCK